MAKTAKIIQPGKLEWVEGKGTCWRPPLVRCVEPGCRAEFFGIADRRHPELCIEHAADVDRLEYGWTPANSLS